MTLVWSSTGSPDRVRTTALAVLGDPLFSANAGIIGKTALEASLVTVSNNRTIAQAGILLTYGPSLLDLHKRASLYVDKILEGAVPYYLPVEQPTTFELIINLKTAKTIGLSCALSLDAALLSPPARARLSDRIDLLRCVCR